jgi:DNA (cytosine-5)-methyltransferase 1
VNYYNEIDPYCAAWLQNLIDAGHIPFGIVDTRSIEDIAPYELEGYTQCHFFAGIGGWSLALRLAGWPDSRRVWTGSCPCQPFSAAGKGAGFDDERHLWPAWQHLIAQCRPAVIFGEQVASKAVDAWINLVHADLEGMGYAFGSVPFPAAGVGAPHIRDRNYWMADAASSGRREECADGGRLNAGDSAQGVAARPEHGGGDCRPGPTNGQWADADWLGCTDGKWRPVSASPQPLVDGLPIGLGRVRPGVAEAIEKEIIDYAKTSQARPDQVLRDLCDAFASEAQQSWPIGGLPGLQSPPFLLAFVCQLAAQGWNLAQCLPLSSAEDAEDGMRMLWNHETASRAPHRRGLDEQRPEQLADALRVLSPILALHAYQAWDKAHQAYAETVFPLGHNLAGRVGRLRAYGNAIVPAQAAEFVAAFLEMETVA